MLEIFEDRHGSRSTIVTSLRVEQAAEQPIPVSDRDDVRREPHDVVVEGRRAHRSDHRDIVRRHGGPAVSVARPWRRRRSRRRPTARIARRVLLGAAFGRTRLLRTRGFAGSALLARLWYHLAPPGAARSKHSRESHEGVPWGCNDRCEPGHELDPGHHTILAAPSAVDVLEPVRYAPARQSAQPFERERRTRSVSRQALAPEIVAGFDADASMHVEPITFDGECGLVGALFRGPVPVVLRAVA